MYQPLIEMMKLADIRTVRGIETAAREARLELMANVIGGLPHELIVYHSTLIAGLEQIEDNAHRQVNDDELLPLFEGFGPP